MRKAIGQYTDWQVIDYRPAIAQVLPYALLPYLSDSQTALEIGCNAGSVSLFLARHGLNVIGVDINPAAISTARAQADKEGSRERARFLVADITKSQDLGSFDVVLMIRVLTCFPSPDSWRRLLRYAFTSLVDGGLIYINDFVLDENSTIYRDRYEAGARLGWRFGNFAVNDAEGNLLFVAHHHSAEELNELTSPYQQQELQFYKSLSMNGNQCKMFEFIGRKQS
jgi:SAM-dependent methyltransferase